MTCPHCAANMSELNHGICPSCHKYCGCSFSPTSMNDYCKWHRPILRSVKDIESDVLQCVNQPVIDSLIAYVKEGRSHRALAVLMLNEGHWLPRAEAETLLKYWRSAYET